MISKLSYPILIRLLLTTPVSPTTNPAKQPPTNNKSPNYGNSSSPTTAGPTATSWSLSLNACPGQKISMCFRPRTRKSISFHKTMRGSKKPGQSAASAASMPLSRSPEQEESSPDWASHAMSGFPLSGPSSP